MADLNIVASIENQETIKKSVANGMGISILSRLATEDEVKEERILAIPIPYADDGETLMWYIIKIISCLLQRSGF